MALFAPLSTLRAQLPDDARFRAALDYLDDLLAPGSAAHARLAALAAGTSHRVDLADGLFAIEQAYLSRRRPEAFFESHRKYIDLQLIVAGEELMEVEDIARLEPTMAYDAERDVILYTDTPRASRLRMRVGDAAVFHPADGHMPALCLDAPALVRKSVVKVPVA